MRTSETITKEIQDSDKLIGSLERQLEEQNRIVESLTAKRKQIAFLAHGESNKGAQAELTKAHRLAMEASLKGEDLTNALATAKEKHTALTNELDRVQKSEQWDQAMHMAEDLIEEAKQVDRAMEEYLNILASHDQKIRELQRIAQGSGRSRFAALGTKHAWRRLDYLSFAATGGRCGSKTWGETYKTKSYSEILREIVENGELQAQRTEAA